MDKPAMTPPAGASRTQGRKGDCSLIVFINDG